MKSITKKIIVYSMIGLMQVGFFASVAAASSAPSHNNGPQRIQQLDDRDEHDREHERRRQHDERLRKENERHEKEMKRRPHESEREWRERQEREKERHENELREIAALLIGVVIGSSK